MIQLYFVEYSRDNAKKQLKELQDDVDGARAVKKEYEQKVAEKISVVKALNRELQRLEHKVTKQVKKIKIFTKKNFRNAKFLLRNLFVVS